MRKILAVMAVIAVTAFPAAAAGGKQAGGLTWQETQWELGVAADAGKQEHLYRFKNAGPRPVVIKKVNTSCGCTAAVVSGRRLYRPGDEGAIKVTFNPAGHSGSVSTAVKVTTNQQTEPVDLFIKAEVSPPENRVKQLNIPAARIRVTPREVDLGVMKPGERKIYRLVVGNEGREPLRISNINARNPSDDQPLSQKRIMPGKKVELTGVYQAGGKGPVDDFLVLRTNDPRYPAYRVRITGRVR